jgi:hypothetical protein
MEMSTMKPMMKIVVVASALSVPLAFSHTLLADADKASKSVEHPQGAGMAMMPMAQQMQRMHEEMTKIHDTKDPKKRHELMREHANSMQSMMQMMHGMMAGQGMMQGPMGGAGTGAPQGMGPGMGQGMGPGSGAMMGRMGMMEKRMNMMQMMMDQMLKQQELLLEDRFDSDS